MDSQDAAPLFDAMEKESTVATKPIVLRQHIRGSDTTPYVTLSLSLGELDICYTILFSAQGQLQIEDGLVEHPGASAVIHTQNGSVCVESVKPIVSVQSIPSGFDGTSANGIMLLQVSDVNRRVYYQLHPRESLFIDSRTISIVPEEDRDAPVSQSVYDSYSERVSQQVSQYQSPSLRTVTTPANHRARSTLSSPVQIKLGVNRMEMIQESRDESSSPKKPTMSGIDCGVLMEAGAEGLSYHTQDTLIIRDPFLPVLDDTANPYHEDSSVALDPQSVGKNNESNVVVQNGKQKSEQQEKEVDRSVSPLHTSRIESEALHNGEDHQSGEPEENINDDLGHSESPGSAATISPELGSRKRRRLNPRIVNSSEDETQDSMKSNIVVQMPQVKHEGSARHASPLKDTLQGTDSGAAFHEGHDQDQSTEALQVTMTTEDHGEGVESVTKANPKKPTGPEGKVRILFASSTSVKSSRTLIRFLERQGVEEVSDVSSCNCLCLSKKSELKKTSKVIMAVLQGKSIITDDWVIRSADAGKLLEMEDFKVKDQAKEAEWGVVMDEAIQQNKHKTPKPFSGWNIVFTSAAKKDAGTTAFQELREIALYAGAKECSARLMRKSEESQPTIFIAGPDDPASGRMNGRQRYFTRDIIGLSSLRGKLDVDSDEFLVRNESKTSKGRMKCKTQKQ